MPVRTRILFDHPALVFITTVVKDHMPLFDDPKTSKMAIAQFVEICKFYKASVVGYVLMPSHLHALVGLKNLIDLPLFIQAFKSLSSRRLKKTVLSLFNNDIFMKNDKYSLWQRGYDDLVITTQKQLKIKLNYIHGNPVKAGLVNDPADYIFSSAADWLSDRNGMIPIDKSYSWLKG